MSRRAFFDMAERSNIQVEEERTLKGRIFGAFSPPGMIFSINYQHFVLLGGGLIGGERINYPKFMKSLHLIPCPAFPNCPNCRDDSEWAQPYRPY